MDTNKMRDISREQFEAEFRRQFPTIFAAAKAGESKAHGDMSVAWWGWQTSRAAVVVELPDPNEVHDTGDYCAEAIDAIEAQGLKVAP